jgi:hypothetical protein
MSIHPAAAGSAPDRCRQLLGSCCWLTCCKAADQQVLLKLLVVVTMTVTAVARWMRVAGRV